jgi:hypothetical protein
MVYHTANPENITVQFFVPMTETELQMLQQFIDDEISFVEFEEEVRCRVIEKLMNPLEQCVPKQLEGELRPENIIVRVHENDDGNALVICRFSIIENIDETGENESSVFTQILHTTKRTGTFYLNAQKSESWTMWPYLANNRDYLWPPPKYYAPFITHHDYKTFDENDDDLQRCLESFKNEFPAFLRARWRKDFEVNIQEIERSSNPILIFNTIIGYPGSTGAEIIDGLFTDISDEEAEMLSEDVYSIIGYFYGINFL